MEETDEWGEEEGVGECLLADKTRMYDPSLWTRHMRTLLTSVNERRCVPKRKWYWSPALYLAN